jgi:hypothetical protein
MCRCILVRFGRGSGLEAVGSFDHSEHSYLLGWAENVNNPQRVCQNKKMIYNWTVHSGLFKVNIFCLFVYFWSYCVKPGNWVTFLIHLAILLDAHLALCRWILARTGRGSGLEAVGNFCQSEHSYLLVWAENVNNAHCVCQNMNFPQILLHIFGLLKVATELSYNYL